MIASLVLAGIYTFAFPDEARVDYGKVTFGSERPRFVGKTDGLSFRVCDMVPDGEQTRVVGLRYEKGRQAAEVYTALTTDAVTFTDAQRLYRLPKPDIAWLAGDVVLAGDDVHLLICDCGRPAMKGHRFHLFSGKLDGTDWAHRNEEPIYKGQDAFGLVWDEENHRFINYQTTYQKWPKRYKDNMGDDVRRVLHVRTSPDCLTWTPGGSFGVLGPHLPEDQLIVPDQEDPEELEFYKFRPVRFGDYWAGAMLNYVPDPPGLPRSGALPHGPFLSSEWWVSRNGMDWQRPFRETSDLAGINFKLGSHFHTPIQVGDEFRWLANRHVYAMSPERMFFLQGKANTEITTPVLPITENGFRLNVSFESVRQNALIHMTQGYLMAELRTSDDQPIAGFEREKCRFLPSEQTALPLAWNDKKAPTRLPAEGVRLKLYFRDMRLYSVQY